MSQISCPCRPEFRLHEGSFRERPGEGPDLRFTKNLKPDHNSRQCSRSSRDHRGDWVVLFAPSCLRVVGDGSCSCESSVSSTEASTADPRDPGHRTGVRGGRARHHRWPEVILKRVPFWVRRDPTVLRDSIRSLVTSKSKGFYIFWGPFRLWYPLFLPEGKWSVLC